MFRPLFVLLLLLNYLLVVGMSVRVEPPSAPRYSVAHPYVHSHACQQHHYLRLDCFERCNGDQHRARPLPRSSAPHLLALLKRLDEHCPAAAPTGGLLPLAFAYQLAAARYPAGKRPDLPTGFAGRGLRPPQPA